MAGARSRLLGLLPLRWSRALRFRASSGRWPDFRHPAGFSEKVNWRVLEDDRVLFEWTCDKLRMREHALAAVSSILVSDIIWSGTRLEDLDEVAVTGRWILKGNDGSGNTIVGAGKPDVLALKAETALWRRIQWPDWGERAYAYAAPGFVVERWIGQGAEAPDDLKVLVFDGLAQFVMVHSNRLSDHRVSIYTRDWVRVPASHNIAPAPDHDAPRPAHLQELLDAAEKIAAGFDFLRVDLFDTAEGVWFGETTPYPWSGVVTFSPYAFDLELGNYWRLPTLAADRARMAPLPARTGR